MTEQDTYKNAPPVFLNSSGGGIAATLTATYWKGAGTRNGDEREFIVIYRPKADAT